MLLAGDQVRLAPLYDTVPVVLYHQYRPHRYAMPVGNATGPGELSERQWRRFAERAGLDPDRVCDTVFPIIETVADRYEGTFGAHLDQHRLALARAHVRVLRRTLPRMGQQGSRLGG